VSPRAQLVSVILRTAYRESFFVQTNRTDGILESV